MMKILLFYLKLIHIAVRQVKENPSEVSQTDYNILWKIAEGLGFNIRLFGTDAHIPNLHDRSSETIITKKIFSPHRYIGLALRVQLPVYILGAGKILPCPFCHDV